MAGDLSTSFDACQHKSALEVNYGWRVEGMARRTDFTEKIKTARNPENIKPYTHLLRIQ